MSFCGILGLKMPKSVIKKYNCKPMYMADKEKT